MIKKSQNDFIDISIVIITLGRDSLYPLVTKLLKQNREYNFEIILVPQKPLNEGLLDDERIRIFYENRGKGFAYYRNIGIMKSRGKIITFIDDDEEPMDVKWLNKLVSPIINKEDSVTTSGCYIPLGNGYLTDAISYLGFPGGGFVGFRTMWDVNSEGYTSHLCSGNCAFEKSLLEKIGFFDQELSSGNEDVGIAEKILQNSVRIKYIDEATVFHSPRSGIINFIRWNFKRGKSAYEFKKSKKLKGKHLKGRLDSSIKILKISFYSKYFPMILTLTFLQYFSQISGYINGKTSAIYDANDQ
jgi:GT2 family glycosyltransferase